MLKRKGMEFRRLSRTTPQYESKRKWSIRQMGVLPSAEFDPASESIAAKENIGVNAKKLPVLPVRLPEVMPATKEMK